MKAVLYRESDESDIPAMARIRAAEWETEEYWRLRIARYLKGELHPRQALQPRVSYVALQDDAVVGFIAGHLTERYQCQGELEWINVVPERRGSAVASGLLRRLAEWFVQNEAPRVCVDVEPENLPARRFYTRHGARPLNPHWLVWDNISAVVGKPERSRSKA